MESKNKKTWLVAIGILLILISVISIILFLLNGQTIVTGQNGGITKSASLTCEGSNISYRFLSYDDAKSKNAKITASFNDDRLNAISFAYSLYYDNPKTIESSKTINSAKLNVFYGEDGLPANSFSKSLYSDTEKVVISLYVSADNFDNRASKYFMADGLDKNSSTDAFLQTYEAQGFECKGNNITKEVNEK